MGISILLASSWMMSLRSSYFVVVPKKPVASFKPTKTTFLIFGKVLSWDVNSWSILFRYSSSKFSVFLPSDLRNTSRWVPTTIIWAPGALTWEECKEMSQTIPRNVTKTHRIQTEKSLLPEDFEAICQVHQFQYVYLWVATLTSIGPCLLENIDGSGNIPPIKCR